MKVLVCGSRYFTDYEKLKGILDACEITAIIHGEARGADSLAGRYGRETGKDVQCFPANWNMYGKSAGPIRNAEMLKRGNPDRVIAFRGPNSRGTQDMINKAKKAGIPVEIHEI